VDPALELLGLLHTERRHHVLVTWTDWDGQTASIVMRLHKKAVREISNAFVLYSGKPLSARPGDREWLLEEGVQLEPDSYGLR
jgi:hypothetical protein